MVRHIFFSRGQPFFFSAKTHAILNSKVRCLSFIFLSINDLYNYSAIDIKNHRGSEEEVNVEQQTAIVMDVASDFGKGERFAPSFLFFFKKNIYPKFQLYRQANADNAIQNANFLQGSLTQKLVLFLSSFC